MDCLKGPPGPALRHEWKRRFEVACAKEGSVQKLPVLRAIEVFRALGASDEDVFKSATEHLQVVDAGLVHARLDETAFLSIAEQVLLHKEV